MTVPFSRFSLHVRYVSATFPMPHGVPPGHRRGIAARNAGNCVRLLWFLQADQVRKNQRTCRPSAETKDAECRRHWNTITPACELSTAAHAPLSGHCIMLPFSMGYIELYEPLPFIGDLPVQFSYENETPPLRKHNLHGIGLRPISAQKRDFALCGDATRCPQDI